MRVEAPPGDVIRRRDDRKLVHHFAKRGRAQAIARPLRGGTGSGMRLSRATLDDGPRVLLDAGDGLAVATVGAKTFADLPELLEAAQGSGDAIEPGDAVAGSPPPLSAVGKPAKVICIGLNYRLHAQETGATLPQYPMLFPKWATSVTDPGADIELPPESSFVDWESELTVVFGKRCRRVPESGAAERGVRLHGRQRCVDARLPAPHHAIHRRQGVGPLDAGGAGGRPGGAGRRDRARPEDLRTPQRRDRCRTAAPAT